MKEKHVAGWITTAMIIIVSLLYFPHLWFQIKTEEFHRHIFAINGNVQIQIHSYQKDVQTELTTQRDKNVVLSAMKREVEFDEPLFYRLPLQIKGEHEIYEVDIADISNGRHWIFYIGDNTDYNYLFCGNYFNAGLAVSEELLDILDETTG